MLCTHVIRYLHMCICYVQVEILYKLQLVQKACTSCNLYIYWFEVLRRFQHCTGHITTGSWKGRGNQYIQFVRVLYCKLPTNSKQLPAFPLEAVQRIEPRPQRWEASVLPLCHHGPLQLVQAVCISCNSYKIGYNLYRISLSIRPNLYNTVVQVGFKKHFG